MFELANISLAVCVAEQQNSVSFPLKKIIRRPRRDSNSQSSDSKSDALSIRPRGHAILCGNPNIDTQYIQYMLHYPYTIFLFDWRCVKTKLHSGIVWFHFFAETIYNYQPICLQDKRNEKKQ